MYIHFASSKNSSLFVNFLCGESLRYFDIFQLHFLDFELDGLELIIGIMISILDIFADENDICNLWINGGLLSINGNDFC